MRFERLELLNWDIQANQVVVLQPGINLLTGENGSGKTTILDAIKVVLGGTRIGGDRSVEDYLATRAAPFAMIRLVADNQPHAESRTRPFDAVQPSERDQFTLAVVYEASDDGYSPRWYFCPGDVSPLQPGFEGRSFTRKSDYTDRLNKLGMGKSFRQLLCTPQGQVASLCQHAPDKLFDVLFDFIGGKQVLDDWETLRKAFERQQRERDDRGQVLARVEAELKSLRGLLWAHRQYRGHLDKLDLATRALPFARLQEARAELSRVSAEVRARETQHAASLEEMTQAVEALRGISGEEQSAKNARDTLTAKGRELDQRGDQLKTTRAGHAAKLSQLDQLRRSVEHLTPADLTALREQRTGIEDAQAELRRERKSLEEQMEVHRAEQERLKKGLLTPPSGVDAFRAVLRNHEVPHHLLLDLIEPQTSDPKSRRALESYLGDFRFAVAVPDIPSFTRAIALARAHHFPFFVLAPDVRSPSPTTGEHPFLEQVRVLDPKYRGLVIRVLRGVRWLEGEVTDTHRDRSVLVDDTGFVLDRKGGRYQGTERYYLGREALERRQAELTTALAEGAQRLTAIGREYEAMGLERERLNTAIDQEEQRQRWLKSKAEHAHVSELVAGLDDQIETWKAEHEGHRARTEDYRRLELDLASRRKEQELRRDGAKAAAARQERGIHEARQERERAETEVTSLIEAGEAADAEARAYTEEHPLKVLLHIHAASERALQGFTEEQRDKNLPANVQTLEKQVQDVEGELVRLDSNVDEARAAADRAHQQYRNLTRRAFARYFASLSQAAVPLGFVVEGGLRGREDGRFSVDVKVAAGEKQPVPYGSPSLSGGQKAAISMLMAMTTLRVHDANGGPGFFLVDEPFSASDTHKIQELGAFLERTGAQYLVSMPTTEELRRCGSWLQAVLTCTKTPGGRDADGQLRIALPVKVSYVVRDDD